MKKRNRNKCKIRIENESSSCRDNDKEPVFDLHSECRPLSDADIAKLWDIEAKIKALSFLMESYQNDGTFLLGKDFAVIRAGLGKIFWELAEDLAKVRSQVE